MYKKNILKFLIICCYISFVSCDDEDLTTSPILDATSKVKPFCGTGSLRTTSLSSKSTNARLSSSNLSGDIYKVRIKPWIISRSNETGGQSINDVNQSLNILQQDFDHYNITFEIQEIDYIGDDVLFDPKVNVPPGHESEGLESYNDRMSRFVTGSFPGSENYLSDDRIDIFFFPFLGDNGEGGGFSEDTPGRAISLGGVRDNQNPVLSSIISHEMGHCLGLHHTYGPAVPICEEIVRGLGPNRQSCGDLVSDTNAAPSGFSREDVSPGNCQYNGSHRDENNTSYNPMIDNLMTVSWMNCIEGNLTDRQVKRMKEHITESNVLQPIVWTDNTCKYSSWKLSSSLPSETSTTIANASTIDFNIESMAPISNSISPNIRPVLKVTGSGSKFLALYKGLSFPVEPGTSVEIEIDGTEMCESDPGILAEIQFLKFFGTFGQANISVELIHVSANHQIHSSSNPIDFIL